jgi:hypothetical protein
MSDFDLKTWRAANASGREAATRRLAEKIGPEYVHAEPSTVDALPAFRHARTGIVFRVVPGGPFMMGFSDADAHGLGEAAEEAGMDGSVIDEFVGNASVMKPVHEVVVAAFLLAERPVSNAVAANLRGEAHPKKWADLSSNLEWAEAEILIGKLEALGLRLPSEAEWEHASRAGRTCRFASGDAVPKKPSIGANPWGFVDCGADAELCADGWRPTYAGAPADGSPRRKPKHPVTCRGGAARAWPWQDTGEWLMMLCAYRESADDADEFLAIRPARSLPT